jgi:hypothetical protein
MDFRLLFMCILALPAPFFLFQEWRIQRGYSITQYKSCFVLAVLAVLQTVSIGIMLALIGYGFGYITSEIFSSYLSIRGIVSMSLGSGIWFGICGLVIGFSLALRHAGFAWRSE